MIDLKLAIDKYYRISDSAWQALQEIVKIQEVSKGELVLRAGNTARNIHFINKGSLRTFYIDKNGNTYNKNLFLEGKFAAAKVSLLTKSASYFSIEALEDTILYNINFEQYKALQDEYADLQKFYIAYIEQSWIIYREQIEIAIVMLDAKDRYLKFLNEHPGIEERIAQHHIAAHLGITPTQLSRIRKSIKNNPNQHM
ncbi:Crp/Fnr family transcriptional regulator [Reichenbachiella versicolor]|uniref:Crp/Fnr family transcriptional regulator n=1 Tax=Reichenbachiella versicolor TaxID=1821036 RepID=UPI000D6E8987|nr:Crp/Fnr family transcriptional regulator [Reichenbachiella versicolor]